MHTGKEIINPVSSNPGPGGLVASTTVHSEAALIIQWTLTEGTDLVLLLLLLLLLAGWFLLSLFSQSSC